MTTPGPTENIGALAYGACTAAGWLGFAATPTFAVMAWISAGVTAPLCSTSDGLPMGGMAWMYLLMSLFHLPAWLKLASRHIEAPHLFATQKKETDDGTSHRFA